MKAVSDVNRVQELNDVKNLEVKFRIFYVFLFLYINHIQNI